MEKVAAIDIGSNAIRFVVGGVDDFGKLQIYRKMREPVRLGKDAFEKERTISIESITAALKAFEKFKRVVTEQKIQKVRAVATSAVREAVNGKEFADIIFKAHSIKIDVIDGLEEAKIIQSAVSYEMDLKGKRALLIDIGGGSVELTSLDGTKVLSSESLKLGTLRLLKLSEKDKMSDLEIDRYIKDSLTPFSKRLAEEMKSKPFDFSVGTGGNAECLGVIRAKFLNKTSMSKIYSEELEKIIKKLSQMSIKERAEKWKLRPDRADVILPAAQVILRSMTLAKTELLLLPRVGLKDGVLWSLIKS
jgi:exopolyphosphatase/guanosine-5'-triphosphate,3'-diphosphate pyrophosphatase